MLSNLGLRGMRIDLTQNRLYTLSEGTKKVLAEIKEPIDLNFYFSRDVAAKQSPLIMPYAARVREFLEEIAARSGGKIHLRVIDPQPFSDEEDHAAEAGLQSLQVGAAGDALLLRFGRHQFHGRPVRHSDLSARSRGIFGIRRGETRPRIGDAEKAGDRTHELAAHAGSIQPDDRPDGRNVAHPEPDRAAVHGAHADERHRANRQGRRCADAGASEAAAAENPVRHRPIRHARRKDTAVRRSGQRRRFERSGSFEPVRRRDGESLLEPRAAARGVGHQLRSG